MQLRTRSSRQRSSLRMPTTSSTQIVEIQGSTSSPSGGQRVFLLIGLPKRAPGKRGANPKEFIRSTVCIGAKQEYTRCATNSTPLRIKPLLIATNNVFSAILSKVFPTKMNEATLKKLKLTEKTFRRKCHTKDYKNSVPKSYMGVPYEELDGRNASQVETYRTHVEATGLESLIDWLIKVVLNELDAPGTAEYLIQNKVFTEKEKRAFNIEINGPKAMAQKIDSNDIDATTVSDSFFDSETAVNAGSTLESISGIMEHHQVEERAPMAVDAAVPAAVAAMPAGVDDGFTAIGEDSTLDLDGPTLLDVFDQDFPSSMIDLDAINPYFSI